MPKRRRIPGTYAGPLFAPVVTRKERTVGFMGVILDKSPLKQIRGYGAVNPHENKRRMERGERI